MLFILSRPQCVNVLKKFIATYLGEIIGYWGAYDVDKSVNKHKQWETFHNASQKGKLLQHINA